MAAGAEILLSDTLIFSKRDVSSDTSWWSVGLSRLVRRFKVVNARLASVLLCSRAWARLVCGMSRQIGVDV